MRSATTRQLVTVAAWSRVRAARYGCRLVTIASWPSAWSANSCRIVKVAVGHPHSRPEVLLVVELFTTRTSTTSILALRPQPDTARPQPDTPSSTPSPTAMSYHVSADPHSVATPTLGYTRAT